MATIKINGKEYPLPESFTMGELADMETVTGQGYDMGQRGLKGMLAIAWIAARRVDASVTIDDIRNLRPDQIEAADESEVVADPPTTSVGSGSSSDGSSVNGSEPTPDATRERTGTPA